MPKNHRLARSSWIARPIAEVFAFFSDASNLEAITPPFLRFRIITPAPIEMREGTRIDYALSLWGLPVRWRTLITCFEPNRRFVDEQEAGPYAYWHHLHEFVAEGEGTRMTDELTYRLPFGTLGALAHPLWVERQLAAIFDYREQAIARWAATSFRTPASAEPGPRLRGTTA
jgi:ligand-binding SRPBCC domain-containing protein